MVGAPILVRVLWHQHTLLKTDIYIIYICIYADQQKKNNIYGQKQPNQAVIILRLDLRAHGLSGDSCGRAGYTSDAPLLIGWSRSGWDQGVWVLLTP